MINDTLLVNIFDSVHIEGEGWDYIYRLTSPHCYACSIPGRVIFRVLFVLFFSMIWGERWLLVLVNCWQSLLNLLFVIILYILISIKTFAHALNQISAHIGKSQCHRLTYMTYFMWQCCRHEYTCSWCTVHLTFNNNQSIKYFQLFSLYIVILL